MQALTADYRKNLVTFQSFSLCVLPLPPQNETAAIKILLLFETGLCIVFGLRKS